MQLQFNQLFGRYTAMAENMKSLTKDILSGANFKALNGVDTILREQMLQVEAKIRIIDIYKNSPTLKQSEVHTKLLASM
jgi:hypothetical protein